MTEPKPSEKKEQHRPAPGLRGSTLLITNGTKIVGLYIAIHEMVIRANARQSVVAFCALTLIGTQVFESIMMRVIDRIFARELEE